MFSALALLLAQTSGPPPLVRTPVQEKPVRATPNPPPNPPITPRARSTPQWRFQNWVAFDGYDYSLSSTTNEAGSAFGVICGEDCVWFVNFQKTCNHGESYPAMVNSPASAEALQLKCYRLQQSGGTKYLLTFPMSDGSIDILVTGGEIGFAFPLKSGQFGVSRFSLTGGAAATMKAMEIILERRNSNQEGLRDFTI